MPLHFKEFLGNRDIIERFLRMAQQGSLPPAMLLVGPEGVGKKTFGLLAAQYLNCQSPQQDDACGQCASCLKITAGVHPDVRLIAPEGAQIKIEQMREMSSDLQFRPFEGKRKVYLLDHAEKLNEPAANSILKTLEECPPYAWIVLVTAHPNALLPTIRSRCPVYNFAPVPTAEIEKLLEHRGLASGRATVLARICGGSIGRALSQDWEELEKQRNRGLSLLEQLGRSQSFHAVHTFWSQLTTEEQTRQTVEDLLKTLLLLLHEILMVKELRPSEVANSDIFAQLERIAAFYPFERISELEAQIRTALREMQRNVNPQILMESLYFERS